MTGMYDHSGRLVHHEKILVLIYYIQRNILRLNLETFSFIRHYETDDIARTDNQVSLGYLVIHPHISVLYGELHPMSGSVHKMASHIFIHPQRSLPVIHIHAEMLEHPLLILIGGTLLHNQILVIVFFVQKKIFILRVIHVLYYLPCPSIER